MRFRIWSKRNVIAGCIALAILAYFVSGPYRTIAAIKYGIVNNDAEALAENIDFVTLRQCLKDQFNAEMSKSMSQNPDDGMQLIALGIATLFLDQIIDHAVSPSGLSQIASGEPLEPVNDDQSPSASNDIFKNGRYRYDSFNSFSVTVPEENGKESSFVLKRRGWSWKLCYLYVPPLETPAEVTGTQDNEQETKR